MQIYLVGLKFKRGSAEEQLAAAALSLSGRLVLADAEWAVGRLHRGKEYAVGIVGMKELMSIWRYFIIRDDQNQEEKTAPLKLFRVVINHPARQGRDNSEQLMLAYNIRDAQ
ncbi:MAG: hypothetical protein WBC05_08685, partial [Sedimentisphaerales bacterium]